MQMDISERARAFHRSAVVVDGHSDILLPVVQGFTTLMGPFTAADRERWQTVVDHEPAPAGSDDVPYATDSLSARIGPAGQYELPLLEAGGVTAQCVALYMHEEHCDDALSIALRMIAALHRHVDEHADRCLLATSVADIRRAAAENKVAYILTMEGAEPVGRHLEMFDILRRLGLRMTTFTHSRRNLLADGTQMNITTGGLTHLGRQAVRRCEELGIVIDTAHISDAGFWDLIEHAEKPILCSHTSVLTLTPGYRAPWDEINSTYGMSKAEAIAKQGGLIGIVFFGMDSVGGLVNEADRIIEICGPEHVGLGSDYYGRAGFPSDMPDISYLPLLTQALMERGYDEPTLRLLLGENYLRIFEQVWGG